MTEILKAEEALRQSEEQFRRVFEEGQLGMVLVGLDFRFPRLNKKFCPMVGYSEAELFFRGAKSGRRQRCYNEHIDAYPGYCSKATEGTYG